MEVPVRSSLRAPLRKASASRLHELLEIVREPRS
jgi:hypothetical protein